MTLQHRFAISAAAGRSKYGYIKPEERAEFKNNDNISHFICRLAYCRNEELRKWFLTQESRLFQVRMSEVDPKVIQGLLESKCGISYQACSENDQDWIKFSQNITYRMKTNEDKKPSCFVKVPFKEAISLVGRRQVFLFNGFAYVPIKELTGILSAHFRARVSAELAKAFKFMGEFFKDERISSLLMNLSNHNMIDFNLEEVKAPSDEKIRLSDLDYYSRKHFPPCMKALMVNLRNKHHLKHFGRLQFGLFLKGLGLNMDEAI